MVFYGLLFKCMYMDLNLIFTYMGDVTECVKGLYMFNFSICNVYI